MAPEARHTVGSLTRPLQRALFIINLIKCTTQLAPPHLLLSPRPLVRTGSLNEVAEEVMTNDSVLMKKQTQRLKQLGSFFLNVVMILMNLQRICEDGWSETLTL